MLKVFQKSIQNAALCGFQPYLVLERSCSLNFQNNYSNEESNQILKIVNSSVDDIARFSISKGRVSKISSWKLKNGPFSSVEQILEVDGFGVKVLEKFCESILKPCDSTESSNNIPAKPSKKIQTLVTPKLLEKKRVSIKSCVSVHIGVTNISWCRLDLNNDEPIHITAWNQYEIVDKKLHLSDLVQFVLYINSLLPEADVYVLENPKIAQSGAPKSAVQININLQKSQLIAMISLILANRQSHTDIENSSNLDSDDNSTQSQEYEQQTIFYLRQYLSARLFKTFIGNEKVSTVTVVENLLRTHYNFNSTDADTSLNDKVNLNLNLREIYNNSTNIEREYLGQSLILGLAFLRLCVVKCPKSLLSVSSSLR